MKNTSATLRTEMDWSNFYEWEIPFDINELTHVNSADHVQPASEERCGSIKPD